MPLKVILTGGGSGGHITPLLAVAAELKRQAPDAHIIYIGQKGDPFGDVVQQHSCIDETFTVRAGKFRRYHGEGIMQVLDLPTLFKNIRDALYVCIGIWQSWRLIKKLQPDVVFSRGGFVSVPVGLGAAINHRPYITHDSDSVPGLANRIIARWASVHAVALPEEVYPYPPEKTVTTGIPLRDAFKPVGESEKQHFRSELKLPASAKMVFVIGGGLGSTGVNEAVAQAVPNLLSQYRDLVFYQVVGAANEQAVTAFYDDHLAEAQRGRVHVFGFVDDVYRYSGAADLVITRGGATNLAEFAVQGKACIIIPSAFLTGGHQLKNAQYLADNHAALVLAEEDLVNDPNRLAKQVSRLLDSRADRKGLSDKLLQFSNPNATKKIVEIIQQTAGGSGRV